MRKPPLLLDEQLPAVLEEIKRVMKDEKKSKNVRPPSSDLYVTFGRIL